MRDFAGDPTLGPHVGGVTWSGRISCAGGGESFDVATLLHVGMNIPDKARLFSEVRRVLKPGGLFGIYDQMREADGELAFQVP